MVVVAVMMTMMLMVVLMVTTTAVRLCADPKSLLASSLSHVVAPLLTHTSARPVWQLLC